MLFRRDPDFADAPETPKMAVFVTISPQRLFLRIFDCQPVGLDLNFRLRANIGCETWLRSRVASRPTGTFWPFTTIEKDTGIFASREQAFREDTEATINFHLHPFGTRCYVIIQKSQRFSAMTDTAEACAYLMGAGCNPFSHTFVGASQAHIVLRSGNRLQITGRIIFPCMKGDPDSQSDPMSTAPAPFTGGGGDPRIPAAAQASEQQNAQSGLPLQVQPQFRIWLSAPSPLRQLPPVFDRWKPRDSAGHTRVGLHADPPTPLPPPEPPPATDATRAHTSPSANSIPMLLRAAPSAHTSTPVAPEPARSIPPRSPGRSRYPTPFRSPSIPTAAPAPTPAPAPDATPTVLKYYRTLRHLAAPPASALPLQGTMSPTLAVTAVVLVDDRPQGYALSSTTSSPWGRHAHVAVMTLPS